MVSRNKLLARAQAIGATVVIDRDIISVDLPRHVVSLHGDGMHYREFYTEGFPISMAYADALDWMADLGECPDKGRCEVCDEDESLRK